MNLPVSTAVLGLVFLVALPDSPQAAVGALEGFEDLFPDETLATGTNLKVTRNELDQAFIFIRANKAAQGIPVPTAQREALEAQLLDKLITTKLILARANPAEQEKGKDFQKAEVQLMTDRLGSDEAAERHIIASGVTQAYYLQQLYEQGVVKAVIEREVKGNYLVPEKAIRDSYQGNKQAFTEPESIHIRRIFLGMVSPQTGNPLPEKSINERKTLMAELRRRALEGEEFASLARSYSEDPLTRSRGGEIVIVKGQTKPEFEVPAFGLRPGQVSEVMAIGAGLHLIKMIEHRPAKLRPLQEVEAAIRLNLEAKYIEQRLPGYLERLKKEARVKIQLAP